jgi:hypothetical protein
MQTKRLSINSGWKEQCQEQNVLAWMLTQSCLVLFFANDATTQNH